MDNQSLPTIRTTAITKTTTTTTTTTTDTSTRRTAHPQKQKKSSSSTPRASRSLGRKSSQQLHNPTPPAFLYPASNSPSLTSAPTPATKKNSNSSSQPPLVASFIPSYKPLPALITASGACSTTTITPPNTNNIDTSSSSSTSSNNSGRPPPSSSSSTAVNNPPPRPIAPAPPPLHKEDDPLLARYAMQDMERLIEALRMENARLKGDIGEDKAALDSLVKECNSLLMQLAAAEIKQAESEFFAIAYSRALENDANSIYIADPSGRHAIYMNKTFTRIFGLTKEQISAHGWAPIYPDRFSLQHTFSQIHAFFADRTRTHIALPARVFDRFRKVVAITLLMCKIRDSEGNDVLLVVHGILTDRSYQEFMMREAQEQEQQKEQNSTSLRE